MTLDEIRTAVAELDAAELRAFAEWFDTFLADKWDDRIEADIRAGRLNRAGDQAIEDYKQGRCTPLP